MHDSTESEGQIASIGATYTYRFECRNKQLASSSI